MTLLPLVLLLATSACEPLPPGDHRRTFNSSGYQRSYLLHVPAATKPAAGYPVVLIFHGFGFDAERMRNFCGLNEKADRAGFLAVYPLGTGTGFVRVFNAGVVTGRLTEALPDDVAMTASLLDDLARLADIDKKKVFATGMSNGGMMCYRLAAELSQRIAAIAPVAGTMVRGLPAPRRPVPVLHFHGTADNVVPFAGPPAESADAIQFESVDRTLHFWAAVNHCQNQPIVTACPDTQEDGTTVERISYRTICGNTPVILVKIIGGGHTWPGRSPPPVILGKSTRDISANDLMWEFFQEHPLK